MIPQKYTKLLQKTIRRHFPIDKNKVFIFGSSLKYKDFWDIDVGILGPINHKKLSKLEEELETSTFPYLVDIKDFNKIDKNFSESVLHHQKIKWI